MSKVLYIKANAKPEGESRTIKIADSFVKTYKDKNPEDEVIELDLYEMGLECISKGSILELRGAAMQNDKENPLLKLAYEFAEADKYVVAEPIWNLGIPAILKAYIDYVAVGGITFKYTEKGPVGLCNNKKAVNIITRGGDYSSPFTDSLEMADKYLRNIFGFMGITNYTTLATDCMDIVTQDTNQLMNNAINKATEAAMAF